MHPIATPRSSHFLLWWILGGYLVLTVLYGLLTPAWETNDEIDHVANIEYVLKERGLPPLRLQTWHETHQPPLYYMLAAIWQRSLGLGHFTPIELQRTTGSMPGPNPQLAYLHTYTAEQRAAAIAVHKLRLFSTLLGAVTVLLTYWVGLELTGATAIAAAAAAFVAFLPKFNVVSGAVTNDSLVIMLSSLAFFIALRCQKAMPAPILTPLALGVVAGGAVITKLTSLPVMFFLVGSLLILGSKTFGERARQFGLACVGFLGSTAWWLLYNHFHGRGWLGQKGVPGWLNERFPGMIAKVSWTDHERFLNFLPSQLFETTWYNGGWNQFILPFGFNLILAVAAGACCWSVALFLFRGDGRTRKFDHGLLLAMGCCLAALVPLFMIVHVTLQAQGRLAYTGLSAFAVVATVGAVRMFGERSRLGLLFWPGLLLLLNFYVMLRFLIPLRAS